MSAPHRHLPGPSDRHAADSDGAATVLSVRGLHVTYGARSASGRVEAVRGIDLDLRPGRTLALVGESGSGKSATGLAIMGLLPRGAEVQGSVRISTRQGEPGPQGGPTLPGDRRGERRRPGRGGERGISHGGGIELLGLSDAAMSRHRGADLGMVFQDPSGALNPVLPIGRQVQESLRIHGMPRRAASDRTLELLALVGFSSPRDVRDAWPHELSGGQRQRVAIAIAVANAPAVVIADEPTTALDTCVQAQVLDVLRRATGRLGSALLLITHDLAVVAGLADDVVVLEGGRVVEAAPAGALYAAPEHPYTRRLLAATPRLDGPGPMRGGRPSQGAGAGAPVLEVRGLQVDVESRARPSLLGSLVGRRRPDLRRIVDGVDLAVDAGECLALVGESGAGKSSTLRAVMDLDPRRDDAPTVLLDGEPIREVTHVRRRLHPAVQLVFQDSGDALDPRLPIADLVGEPLTATSMPRVARSARVLELLERVGLDADTADRFTAQLSGGQRQRVAIARALATTPHVLLLDEPVSALDVCVQAEILDLLAGLQEELRLACVVVAHDLAVVARIADRIAVMWQGRIVETGPTREVLRAPRHPYTRALVSAVPIPDPARERARRAIPLVEPVAGADPAGTPHVGGCPVAGRCPLLPLLAEPARALCRTTRPALAGVAEAQGSPSRRDQARAPAGRAHQVACHHPAETVDLLPLEPADG